jgi:hypothetical protein
MKVSFLKEMRVFSQPDGLQLGEGGAIEAETFCQYTKV